jgi:glutamine amidotransferase
VEINKIILPGVSSFDSCIHALKKNGFYDYLKNAENLKNKKILGICAGAQVLFEGSEEGNEEGLGLLKGVIKKIKAEGDIRIPHLGWNYLQVHPSYLKHRLWDQVNLGKRFYFSHSYHFPNSDSAIAFVDYGYQFPVLISNGSVTAVQFHPEKSYHQGLQLLNNFCIF